MKRFTKNDSGFTCAHCGREVEALGYTSRNHCPFCLWSLHVDVNKVNETSNLLQRRVSEMETGLSSPFLAPNIEIMEQKGML